MSEARRAGGAALVLALAVSASTSADAAVTVVSGRVEAVALSGDALVVARQSDRRLLVERREPGRPSLRLFRSGPDGAGVTLAASAGAVALGLVDRDQQDLSATRVLIGPAGGPLREAASCPTGSFTPAVAARGSRVVFSSGGCAEPAKEPLRLGPAAIVVTDAAAGSPEQRIDLPDERVAGRIVAAADGSGVVGLLRPAFLSYFATEVRRFGPDGLGEPVARDPARVVLPAATLPDGGAILNSETYDDVDADAVPCPGRGILLAAASDATRLLDLGGCPFADADEAPPIVAGDRILALVRLASGRRDRDRFTRTALVSLAPDATDRRTLARGTFRGPELIATEAGRAAWTQAHCAGGTELVTAPAVPAGTASRAIASCTLQPLTRRARVRAGRIALRVRCPHGCRGSVVDDTRCGARRLRGFAFERGSHAVRVRLPARLRRAHRALIRFDVDHGPQRSRAVRLRR